MTQDPKDLALEAVLLFHSGSPWDDDRRMHWQNICVAVLGAPRDVLLLSTHQTHEATTRKLCDIVRKVIG